MLGFVFFLTDGYLIEFIGISIWILFKFCNFFSLLCKFYEFNKISILISDRIRAHYDIVCRLQRWRCNIKVFVSKIKIVFHQKLAPCASIDRCYRFEKTPNKGRDGTDFKMGKDHTYVVTLRKDHTFYDFSLGAYPT